MKGSSLWPVAAIGTTALMAALAAAEAPALHPPAPPAPTAPLPAPDTLAGVTSALRAQPTAAPLWNRLFRRR